MAIHRLLLTATLALATIAITAEYASAQSHPRARRSLRWLGQGFGDGFLRCNPGPNTDYYNPYSAHNSYLISQSPQFSQQLLNPEQLLLSRGIIRQGVPFSIYAAPKARVQPNALPHSKPADFHVPWGNNGPNRQ